MTLLRSNGSNVENGLPSPVLHRATGAGLRSNNGCEVDHDTTSFRSRYNFAIFFVFVQLKVALPTCYMTITQKDLLIWLNTTKNRSEVDYLLACSGYLADRNQQEHYFYRGTFHPRCGWELRLLLFLRQ